MNTNFTREFYLRIMRIYDLKKKSDLQVAASFARLSDTAIATYDFLWGIVPGVAIPDEMIPDNFHIYIYDYPPELAEVLLEAPVGCSLGQWGTEVLFHRWLQSSSFVTTDPDKADLFYVPIYATCNIVRKNLNYTETGKVLYDPLFEYLRRQKYWKQYGGIDHVFLFADGQGFNQWPWFEAVQQSILLMVETSCPTWGTPLERKLDIKSCFSVWKDIILPGHTDFSRVKKLKNLRKPLGERKLLFSWRGRSSFIHEAYKKSVTRTEIVETFIDLPGTDVGGFSKTFFQSKTDSQFCLVPSGTSPWSNHLYESIIAGCIPVILSDEYQLPFWHRLDWTTFSLKIPEGKIDAELFDYLASIPHQLIVPMYLKVLENSCWFDWWSTDTLCNPYLGIVEQLADRAQKLRSQLKHDKFWHALGKDPYNIKRKSRFHAERETYDWLDLD